MNTILEQINSTGKAFVEFAVPMLVQSSVLIVILLLADLALRKKVKAVFRYCIWILVLIKLILPTSLSSPLSLGYWFGDHLAYVAESRTAAAPEAEALESALADMLHIIEPVPVEEGRPTPAVLPMMPGVEPAEAEAITPPAVSVTPVTWQGVVFLLWLAVVIALGLLLLQRAMFVRGLVAQAKEANALVNDALKYCCKCMGVKRKIGLKVSANATSPAVCGLFRPVILLPHKLAPSLGSSHLRAVLLHELAHIRRGDLWVNLVQTVLQIGYFYNPLLWLANCVIRRVREQAIDETVLVAMGEKAQQYPQTLVNVAKLAFKRPALSLRLIGVVESKSALAGRIKHILNRPMPKSAKVGILGLLAVIVVGCALLPMARKEPHIPPTSTIDASGRIVDKIDYAFVDDPAVIGTWKSVDFVQAIEDFESGVKHWPGDLYLKQMFIFEDGRTGGPWTWTKGLIIHPGDKTAAKYHIKEIDGSTYMFFEWKSGDYTIRHMKPRYYVLKKVEKRISPESDVRVEVEKSISPKLTMLLGAINSCAAETKLNIESISITAGKISIAGDTSSRTNTQKFLDAIRKNELEILQLNLDTRDNRDKFSIIVEPKKDWRKWWRQHKTDVHVGVEETISPKLVMLQGAINICAAETELNIESISLKSEKINIAGDTSSRTNTQKFLDVIKKNELEILQLNLDTRDGRDKFRIIVEPKKELTVHTGRPFSAALANGVTVELVGICEHPSEGKQWWRPDGTELSKEIRVRTRGRVSASGIPYAVAVKVTMPEDATFELGRIKGATGGGSLEAVDSEGRPISNMRAWMVYIDEKLTETSIQLGAAAGPWKTRARNRSKGGMSTAGIVFSKAYESDGGVRIIVADEHLDLDYRITAIDTQGKEHLFQQRGGSAGKVRQTTALFHDIKLNQIEYFLFQTRPYEWVEFKNVSLRPGVKTDVGLTLSQSREGSVTGTVRFHGTDAPASGVVVKTVSKWFDTVQARTDQQGSYTLAGIIPEAVFHISAEDEQKELFMIDMPAVVLKPGEAKTGVDLTLYQGRKGSISGKVVGRRIFYKKPERLTRNIVPENFERRQDTPLPGVKIVLKSNKGVLKETITDETGRYRFEGLCADGYVVRAEQPAGVVAETVRTLPMAGPGRAEGHSSSQSRWVELRSEPKTDIDLHFRLDGISIAGRVTDTNGNPIGGAKVVAEFYLQGEDEGMPVIKKFGSPVMTLSAADGRYRLDGLCPVTFSETATYLIHGKLYRWYEMRVQAKGYSPAKVLVPPVTEHLVGETSRLMEDYKGLYGERDSSSAEVALPESGANAINGIDFVLQKAAVITGRVLDTQGNVVPGLGTKALVRMVPVDSRDDENETLLVQMPDRTGLDWIALDETGRFKFDGVHAGSYSFEIRTGIDPYDTQRARNETLVVKAGEVIKDLDVIVESIADRGNISGRVLDALSGKPFEAFSVRVSSVDSPGESTPVCGRVNIDESQKGTFLVEGISPGTATLEILASGYVPKKTQVKVASGQTTDMTFHLEQRGKISGRVLDARSGKPIKAFSAKVTRVDSSGEGTPSLGRTTIDKSQEGAFLIEDISTGTATLEVSAPGYAREKVQVKVVSGQTTDMSFHLEQGGKLQVYITLNGEGKMAWVVSARPAGEGPDAEISTQMGKDGRYELTGLKEAEYLVRAPVPLSTGIRGRATVQINNRARVKIEPGKETRLDFELRDNAGIRGTFTSPDKDLSWRILIFDDSAAVRDDSVSEVRQAHALIWKLEQGKYYEIWCLPPGTYRVVGRCCKKDQGWTAVMEKSKTVTVGAGQVAEVDFVFP